MLDQNTDRMWFVIGALVVGAGIILLANKAMPEIFASVTESFEEATDKGLAVIDQIGEEPPVFENVLNPKHINIRKDNTVPGSVSYVDESGILTMDAMFSDTDSAGITRIFTTHEPDHYMVLPYGESYTFSFEVYTPIDLTIRNDINIWGVADDGSRVFWNSNNNDDVQARVINGERAEAGKRDFIPRLGADGGEWTKFSIKIQNSHPENEDKLPIAGCLSVGFFEEIDAPITLQFRNIKGEYNHRASTYLPYGVSVESLNE